MHTQEIAIDRKKFLQSIVYFRNLSSGVLRTVVYLPRWLEWLEGERRDLVPIINAQRS